MVKLLLRTLLAAVVATAIAWGMAGLALALPYTPHTDRVPSSLVVLGLNLGIFFGLTLIGFLVLRLLLKRGQGKLWAYLLGGAVVGVVSAVLTLLIVEPELAFHPWLLVGGALSGLLGGLPISGSGPGPAVLTPVRREDVRTD